MCLSIAKLIRSTLHSKLFSIHVSGSRRNAERLFWLDHKEKDASPSNPAQSYYESNIWELQMTAASISHFIRQGICWNEDIPALTPYLRQLQKLEQRLQLSFAIIVGDQDSQDIKAKGFEDDNGEETTATTGSAHKTTLLNALKIAPVNTLKEKKRKPLSSH